MPRVVLTGTQVPPRTIRFSFLVGGTTVRVEGVGGLPGSPPSKVSAQAGVLGSDEHFRMFVSFYVAVVKEVLAELGRLSAPQNFVRLEFDCSSDGITGRNGVLPDCAYVASTTRLGNAAFAMKADRFLIDASLHPNGGVCLHLPGLSMEYPVGR